LSRDTLVRTFASRFEQRRCYRSLRVEKCERRQLVHTGGLALCKLSRRRLRAAGCPPASRRRNDADRDAIGESGRRKLRDPRAAFGLS
jgi:hypothetical protein